MSVNRLPPNGNGKPHLPPPDLAGGIALDGAIVKDKVLSIVKDRMREGFREPPMVKRVMQIAHGGPLSGLSEEIVSEATEAYVWQIIGEVMSYGFDANAGTITLGEAQVGQTPDGRFVVMVPIVWRAAGRAEGLKGQGPTLVT